MDWNTEEIRRHLKAVHRVVFWLVALADLAERSAFRSPAIRSAVLWLLRPGEEIALDYLAGITGCPQGWDGPIAARFPDTGPTGALAMAQSFRAIAAALVAYLEQASLSLENGGQQGPVCLLPAEGRGVERDARPEKGRLFPELRFDTS